MTKLATISSREMIKFLEYLGFKQIRQRGSHKFFKHQDGRTATIPCHKGEDLGKGITNKILKDIEISKEEFLHWYLRKK